jgi:hypothetical protein
MFHAVLVLSKAILAWCTFARMSCAVLVHTKGAGLAWRWVMYVSIATISSGTLRKTPRRICLVVRSQKTRSTKVSHELLVSVKCMWARGWRLKHRWTVGCVCEASLSAIRCRAFVLGDLAGHQTEERQPFLVPHSSLDDNTPDEFYFDNLPALPQTA